MNPNNPLTGHPASRLPTAADIRAVGTVPEEISAQADIGHVNLTVSDLERAVVFYRDVIGLRVTQRDEDSAFLAAGAYHHHVALNRWDEWPRKPDGSIAMTVAPLDVEALVADAF